MLPLLPMLRMEAKLARLKIEPALKMLSTLKALSVDDLLRKLIREGIRKLIREGIA
jgi:hypothetical protein